MSQVYHRTVLLPSLQLSAQLHLVLQVEVLVEDLDETLHLAVCVLTGGGLEDVVNDVVDLHLVSLCAVLGRVHVDLFLRADLVTSPHLDACHEEVLHVEVLAHEHVLEDAQQHTQVARLALVLRQVPHHQLPGQLDELP